MKIYIIIITAIILWYCGATFLSPKFSYEKEDAGYVIQYHDPFPFADGVGDGYGFQWRDLYHDNQQYGWGRKVSNYPVKKYYTEKKEVEDICRVYNDRYKTGIPLWEEKP